MSMEFWTIPLVPPAMSPRMMSLAFSTMSEAFSTALVAMSRTASTASLGLKGHRSLLFLGERLIRL